MIFRKIRKRFQDVPSYITGFRFLFGIRYLFRKFFNVPVLARTKNGSWLYFGVDTIDEEILKYLNKTHVDVYFPPGNRFNESDSVVLDVGAHHGFYALELTSRFPETIVFSFEPEAQSFALFKRNLRLNSRRKIFPINAALDKNSGNAFIVHSDEGDWGNYVVNEKEAGYDSIRTIAVRDFVAQYKIKDISLIKLNAEGAEFVVIPELLQMEIRPKIILLFAHPEKGDLEQLNKLILNKGYKCDRCHEDAKRPWYIYSVTESNATC
jgi:FkbM family methyltransferase